MSGLLALGRATEHYPRIAKRAVNDLHNLQHRQGEQLLDIVDVVSSTSCYTGSQSLLGTGMQQRVQVGVISTFVVLHTTPVDVVVGSVRGRLW